MALNTTGAISLGGTTVGQSIEIELGGTGTTQISLNNTNVRALAGVPSGTITMPTDFWGKSTGTLYTTWTYRGETTVSRTSTARNAIAWGNSTFVWVNGNSTASHLCYTSPDGITWTYQAGLAAAATAAFGANTFQNNFNIIYFNSLFVAISITRGACYTSPDGITWTYRASFVTAAGSLGTGYIGSDQVLLITSGAQLIFIDPVSSKPIRTTDGITWTAGTAGTGLAWGCCWSNTKYVLLGSAGITTTPRVSTSTTGSTWTTEATSNLPTLIGTSKMTARSPMATNGTVIVVVIRTPAAATTMRCFTSPAGNGVTWTERAGFAALSPSMLALDAPRQTNIVWTGEQFVLINYYQCFTSPDGITWSLQPNYESLANTYGYGTESGIGWNGTKLTMLTPSLIASPSLTTITST